jgi:phytoene dehydrogenase-like protein
MRVGSSVAVVGAGLGGLAAACVSAARGHTVTLYDKNEWLGGKAAVLHEGGFRFDMGPTILTVPKVLERIFQEAGRDIRDYLDLRRLDPQWRCFFDDDTQIDLMADVGRMAADMDRFAPSHASVDSSPSSRCLSFLAPLSAWRTLFRLPPSSPPRPSSSASHTRASDSPCRRGTRHFPHLHWNLVHWRRFLGVERTWLVRWSLGCRYRDQVSRRGPRLLRLAPSGE